MSPHTALAAAATLVSPAFALSALERWWAHGILLAGSGGPIRARTRPEPRGQHPRSGRVAVAVLAVVALTAVPFVADDRPAAAAGGEVADYLNRINSTRAAAGRAPLQLDPQLSALAQSWSQQLASWGRLQHASDLSVGVTQPWAKLGENVGRGGSTGAIYDAFVASPTHYANIVDGAFTKIGIGVVYGADGRQYTTQRYLAPPGGGGGGSGGGSSGGGGSGAGSVGAGAPTTGTTTPPPPPPPPPPPEPPGPGDPVRAALVLDALQRFER